MAKAKRYTLELTRREIDRILLWCEQDDASGRDDGTLRKLWPKVLKLHDESESE